MINVNNGNRGRNNQHYGSSTHSSDIICRFCRRRDHKIADCNDPRYDPLVHKKHLEDVGQSGSSHGSKSKGRQERHGDGGRKKERANVVEVESGSEDDNTMSMDYNCYDQIGKHPSPGIDPGEAYEGGDSTDPSLTPLVCPLASSAEIQDKDITDGVTNHISSSESISECLYHAALVSSNTTSCNTIIDSGCTRTMWANPGMFSPSPNYRTCAIEVHVGDDFTITAQGRGDVTNATPEARKGHLSSSRIVFVPGLKLNLVSVSHLASEGFSTTFDKLSATIANQGGTTLRGERRNNLYHIVDVAPLQESAQAAVTCDLLHHRLGHAASRRIRRLPGMVKGISKKDIASLPLAFQCHSCAIAKGKRASFPRSLSQTLGILDLLHMDLAGPAEIKSLGGNQYLLIITDDHSRYYTSILLKKKSDAFTAATSWIAGMSDEPGA